MGKAASKIKKRRREQQERRRLEQAEEEEANRIEVRQLEINLPETIDGINTDAPNAPESIEEAVVFQFQHILRERGFDEVEISKHKRMLLTRMSTREQRREEQRQTIYTSARAVLEEVLAGFEEQPKYKNTYFLDVQSYSLSNSALAYNDKTKEIIILFRKEFEKGAYFKKSSFFCSRLDALTLRSSTVNMDIENRLSALDFEYKNFGRTAFSADKSTALIFLSRLCNRSKKLFLYNLEKNSIRIGNFEVLKFEGKETLYFMEPDVDNENFRHKIYVELYPKEIETRGLAFYEKSLRKRNFFRKIFEVKKDKRGYELYHSYCKIDRNALHGHEDCLIIYRFCCREADEDKGICDIFYVNMVTKRLLFRCSVVVEGNERIYRDSVYHKIIWSSEAKMVTRMSTGAILVIDKIKKMARVHRHDFQSQFDELCGIFRFEELRGIEGFEEHSNLNLEPYEGEEDWSGPRLDGLFQPEEKFRFQYFDGFCAVWSSCVSSFFRGDEFADLRDFLVLGQLEIGKSKFQRFIQFPFRFGEGVDKREKILM